MTSSAQLVAQLVAAEVQDASTLVLFARDVNGRSVAVRVHNVHPYLYVRIPSTWNTIERIPGEESDWTRFLSALNNEVSKRNNLPRRILDLIGTRPDSTPNHIVENKSASSYTFKRFYGYETEGHRFGRITASSQGSARTILAALEHPTKWMKETLPQRMLNTPIEIAEANIDVAVQACTDAGLSPGGWFTLRVWKKPDFKTGGIRVDTCYTVNAITDVVPMRERSGLAPLKVMSFDIETYTRDIGHGAVKFFDGDDTEGKCLCIAACTLVVGRGVVERVVFAIDPDSKVPYAETMPAVSGEGNVSVRWQPTESDVLLAFAAHLRGTDPDFVTGWNTDKFDWGWLALAAKRLAIGKKFWNISRFYFPAAFYNTRFYGKNADARASKKKVILQLPGRVPYDLMTWVKKNYQLPDYKLQSVAEANECGAKDDVSYAEIGTLFQTRTGRIKLALYCEQDTALVLKLISKPKLDPLGKDMALCSITGTWPKDLLGRGTQNTLRCKFLRVARDRGFVLPHTPGPAGDTEDAPNGEEEDEDDEDEDTGYQGGKVLTAQSGRYTDPVAVFDFASLYPSCMEQQNICKSSQLTRARALEMGVPFTVPPAPSLTGTWRTPSGDVEVVDDFRTGIIKVDGDASFRYETDINEAIVGTGGRRAVLEDGGYALRWHTDSVWTRCDEDVLCFTTREHFTGLVPQLEADLKLDRKAAKEKMAQAEEAGDHALQAYCNNLQNSIKVLMNSLYGGFGAKVGSIFPEGFKLASAITATGRGWICTVKRIIESTMWVASDQRWGINDKPDDASYVRIVYGDTDSVFCHLPGLSLQSAAAFGDAVSKFFSDHVLPYPQKLEFEKARYQRPLHVMKKMYSGLKYEKDYSEDAKGKLHSRGIALVRRDNASLVRSIMKSTLENMLKIEINAESIVESVARYIKLVQQSAASIHRPDRPDDHLPMQQFVLSAGLSKDLDDYAGVPNAAAHVAARLMQLNPLERLGSGTRVVFVVRAQHKVAKRGEQACLVEDLVRERWPLDAEYYIGAIRKKCEPLLSALFVAEEQKRTTFTGAFGGSVTVEHAKASERQALPGQNEAARRLTSALAQLGRVTQSTPRVEVEAPRIAPVFARFAAAATVPRAPAKPAEDKKRKGGDTPAHAILKALKTHAAAKKANASE